MKRKKKICFLWARKKRIFRLKNFDTIIIIVIIKEKKIKLRRGERWGVGVVGHAPGNFLLFRHLHTQLLTRILGARDRFTCTVAVCTRTEGRAERQMAASKNPSKHSMLPSPPSSFHFDWKTATFYPKKNQFKKSFFPFITFSYPKIFPSLFYFFFYSCVCYLPPSLPTIFLIAVRLSK